MSRSILGFPWNEVFPHLSDPFSAQHWQHCNDSRCLFLLRFTTIMYCCTDRRDLEKRRTTYWFEHCGTLEFSTSKEHERMSSKQIVPTVVVKMTTIFLSIASCDCFTFFICYKYDDNSYRYRSLLLYWYYLGMLKVCTEIITRNNVGSYDSGRNSLEERQRQLKAHHKRVHFPPSMIHRLISFDFPYCLLQRI